MSTFQIMPELDSATESALRAAILLEGVVVPIVRDQHGRILDGHQRSRIAADLGVDCPESSCEVRDDEHARELARMLNEDRRQLLDIDKRRRIVTSLREQGHSQRAIAGALGVTRDAVRRDLGVKDAGGAPAPPATKAEPERVQGMDGKSYPARVAPAAKAPAGEPNDRAFILARSHRRDFDEAVTHISAYLEGIVATTKLADIGLVAEAHEWDRWKRRLNTARTNLSLIATQLKENAP